MRTKLLEVRDHMTCIPVIAIEMAPENPIQTQYFWRYGFLTQGTEKRPLVVVMTLNDQQAHDHPGDWGNGSRTMGEAHKFIQEFFSCLPEGGVIDVRAILGELPESALPEIWMGGKV